MVMSQVLCVQNICAICPGPLHQLDSILSSQSDYEENKRAKRFLKSLGNRTGSILLWDKKLALSRLPEAV